MTRTVLIRPVDGTSAKQRPLGQAKKRAIFIALFRTRQLLLLGVCLRRRLPGALREVVVRDERVRREHEALRRHDQRGVLALRLERLLEERALGAFLGRDLVPGLEEL